ncbi:MAG: putative chromosome-partitioning protein ParB [Fimbriimonadaceae bacterium]|nr:putative chromosome-partitioning protein ParB [Fimbriimonadaceae bacterium]
MRRGLGKGLAQLVAEQSDGTELELPLSAIIPNPRQPRTAFHEASIRELADSIQEVGIIQPLLVRPIAEGRYELIAGERRLRAAKLLGLNVVPVIIRSANNQLMLEMSLIENVQREDISALECALAYQRLVDEFGLRQEDVAARVGKSRTAIANTLRLLKLPIEVRSALEQGTISEGHARAILMADGEPRQLRILETIVRNALSVREAEQLARPSERKQSAAKTTRNASFDPDLAAVQDSLSDRFGTTVRIKANKIEFTYYGEEDLTRLCDLLGVEL